jgi:hypothetical protein
MRTLPGCRMASCMSDCAVARRGRDGTPADGPYAAGVAPTLPGSPAVGSGWVLEGDMDARGLGCSLALFVPRRCRPLSRRRTRCSCDAKYEAGRKGVLSGVAESGEDVPTASICPLCQEISGWGNVMERSAQNRSCDQADEAQLQTRGQQQRECFAAAMAADTWLLQGAQCPRPR